MKATDTAALSQVCFGAYPVTAWLDRSPAHQLMRTDSDLLLYRFLPISSAEARRAHGPLLEQLNGAIAAAGGALGTVLAAEAGPELLLVVEDTPGSGLDALTLPLRPGLAFALGGLVVDAVRPLHERNLFHGALTDSRVRFDGNGGVIVVDSGPSVFARAASSSEVSLAPSQPAFVDLYPNPALVPPELLSGGAPGPASDVFAVAGLVFRWLTGRDAYGSGATLAIYSRLRQGARQDLSALPVELPVEDLRVLNAALHQDPASRPTLDELGRTLARQASGEVAGRLKRGGALEPYAERFRELDPAHAPSASGSEHEDRRQEALRRASVTMDVMRDRRPGRAKQRSGLLKIVVGAVAIVVIAVVYLEIRRRQADLTKPPPMYAPRPVNVAPPEPEPPPEPRRPMPRRSEHRPIPPAPAPDAVPLRSRSDRRAADPEQRGERRHPVHPPGDSP